MDTKDVPRGAVAEVTYYSKSLKRFRRMHVYTPPGYESGAGKFPVFYLLHGAMDCDDSWTTVGRAGFIMDNLIAAGKAKPTVVVMPAGHTGAWGLGRGSRRDEFSEDFINDIMPTIENHYRIRAGRQHRAIAGLSMGGSQTLNLMAAKPDAFGYIGVYSSGIFGITRGTNRQGPSWEEQHLAILDGDTLKNGLEHLWFATGKDDFLVETSRASVAMLKNHGLNAIYKETEGAHTWIVWRQYLHEFAQTLFK